MTQNLAALGFTAPPTDEPYRIIASIHGHEKTGKTTAALNSPEPIYFFNFDLGTEGVLSKYPHKQIYLKNIYFTDDQPKEQYEALWKDYDKAFKACVAQGIGTIIVDTATAEYRLGQLAKFGKVTRNNQYRYGDIYDDILSRVHAVYRSNMSAVWVHRVRKQHVGENWNGLYERDGIAKIGFEVQTNLETFRVDVAGQQRFCLRVLDNRRNINLVGRELWDQYFGVEWVMAASWGLI